MPNPRLHPIEGSAIPPPPRIPSSAVAETPGSSAVAEGDYAQASSDASSGTESIDAEGVTSGHCWTEQEIIKISAASKASIDKTIAIWENKRAWFMEDQTWAKENMEAHKKIKLDLEENERKRARLLEELLEKKVMQRQLEQARAKRLAEVTSIQSGLRKKDANADGGRSRKRKQPQDEGSRKRKAASTSSCLLYTSPSPRDS